MLRIDELRVNYGRVPALHGISLHVDEGEAVTLVGPNGAGKTTTLSAIFGLVAPAGGTILFEGESLVDSSPEKILRRGLALVPEGRHIFGTLSVGENLQLGTTARKDRHEADDDLKTRLRALPGAGVVLRPHRRDALRRGAAAARDRACAALAPAVASPRRALARARAGRDRHRLRRARGAAPAKA